MKQKTRVVFSDGSKEMAHNLDDLMERWLLRRQTLPDEVRWREPETFVEDFLPELPMLETVEQARSLRVLLVEKQKIITNQLNRIKQTSFERGWKWAVWQAERSPLVFAQGRADEQLAKLKRFLSDKGESRTILADEILAVMAPYFRQQEEILEELRSIRELLEKGV